MLDGGLRQPAYSLKSRPLTNPNGLQVVHNFGVECVKVIQQQFREDSAAADDGNRTESGQHGTIPFG
jgi:hypothetical protein